MTAVNVGIIGDGGIAKHLRVRLENSGYKIVFVLRRKTYIFNTRACERNERSLQQLLQELPDLKIDVMFLAISTLDTGEAARDYILECVEAGIPVITCEKGALAYHAQTLSKHLGAVRCSAAVGGGTQMVRYLRSRNPNQGLTDIYAVVNGTLNFVFHQISHGGRTLGEACAEAIRLGYAEPGAHNPLSLINGELKDVERKACVLFNTALTQETFLDPGMLGNLEMTARQLEDISRNAGDYRLVVSFSNRPKARGMTLGGKGMYVKKVIAGWNVEIGFCSLSQNPNFQSWLPGSVGNTLHIVEGEFGSGGTYSLSGPGAGHEATTTAMLNDLHSLNL